MNRRSPEFPESPVFTGRVVRSARRTLALEITGEGELVIRAPNRATSSAIDALVKEKQGWIQQKIEEIRKRPAPPVHEYEEGEMFLFLGGSYPLTYTDDGSEAIERLDRLYVPRSLVPGIRRLLKRWYMQEAEKIVRERCAYFSMVSGLLPVSVRVTDAQRRWGSCTSAGKLNFSWRLVQAPLHIVDYVVVHELVHLRNHDHSQKFWRKVEEILPDYRKRRTWLHENEWLLKL